MIIHRSNIPHSLSLFAANNNCCSHSAGFFLKLLLQWLYARRKKSCVFRCFALLQHDRLAWPFTARVIEACVRFDTPSNRNPQGVTMPRDLRPVAAGVVEVARVTFIFHLSSFNFQLYSVICSLFSFLSYRKFPKTSGHPLTQGESLFSFFLSSLCIIIKICLPL